jgi:hypothetical protein
MVVKLHKFALAAAASLAFATAAHATVTVDGVLDADYGAPVLTVTYDPSAPTSNFDDPGKTSASIGYNLYQTSDATNIYGFLQTFGPGTSAGSFTNLYYDFSALNGDAPDVVCEINNFRCKSLAPGALFQTVPITLFDTATTIEFAINKGVFGGADGPIRLSQSFGYSVDTTGAIPEPASWALMLLGFGSLGVALRRRRGLPVLSS